MAASRPRRAARLTGQEVLRAIFEDDDDTSYDSSGSEYSGDSDEDLPIENNVHVNDVSDSESSADEMDVQPPQVDRAQIDPPNIANQWQMPDLVWNRANHEQPQVHAFRGNPGIQVDVTDFQPIDFFQLYMTDDLINHLVIQTNLMAAQFIENNPNLPRYSNVRSWVDTNAAEMKVFVGLMLLMGMDKKPTVGDYWSRNPLHHTPLFSAVMTRNRYQLLLKFCHFNDNTMAPQRNDPNRDRLFKLRPLLDHLFELFQTVYSPTRDVCIDESLVLWKGRLLFRQYIPLKRARFGIKIYCLCESGGYTYRFKIYTGKDDPTNDVGALLPVEAQGFLLTEKVVLHMALPLLDQGHTLWMDNWYTSTRLFAYLHHRSTNACGTIRENRVPIEFRKDRVPANEIVAYRADNLLCIRFQDKKTVSCLTTLHTEETQEVHASAQGPRRRPVNKPVAVVQYNVNMGGVDLQDKMIKPYSAARKTMKWYKKLAVHMLQVAMLNAYLLYKKADNEHKKTFKAFQESVISAMIFMVHTHSFKRNSLTFP